MVEESSRAVRAMSGQRAKYPLHVRHPANGADHAREVLTVAHLQLEFENGAVLVALVQRNLIDIGFGARDAGGYRPQNAHSIVDLELYLGTEQPAVRLLPGDRQPLFGLLAVFGEITAILAVDHHAATRAQIRHDGIVRNRKTAARVADQQAFGAGYHQRAAVRGTALAAVSRRLQTPGDQRGQALAQADLFVQLVGILQMQILDHRVEFRRRNLLQAEREFLEREPEQSPSQFERFAALEIFEVLTDRGTRLGRHQERRPRWVRGRPLGGDDLHRLAVAQRGAQRNQAPVDLGGDAAVADIGMDRIGEIDRGGSGRQTQDLALRREYVHLVREQIDLDVFEKFLRATAFVNLHQAGEPFARSVVLDAAERIAAGFVLPMCGNAGFGDAVHLLGADLHLDRHAARSEQRRVQGLVAVDPRYRDVVLEASRHRFIEAVHQPQGSIAGVGVVDDDAKTVHIDHFVERDALALHLFVDAVKVLFAPLHCAGDPGLFERSLEGFGDLRDEFLLIAPRALQLAFEHLVPVGVQRPKSQIFQFQLDRVQSEALGDRRVDVQSLACNAPSLDRRHGAERAHVVHTVGELDHDDADVAHHRQQHLAEAFRLSLLAILELNLVELADPVNQFGDDLTEERGDFSLGGRRVFDHVVQNGGDQGVGVQAQIGENVRHRDRVGDVGFARRTRLAAVALRAEFIGFPDAFNLRGGKIGFELF